MCRVHGEATECVVFIGRAWTEQAMETRPGVPQNGQNGPPTVETGVLLIERGVALLRLELALDFPEEERMMQHSSVSISLSF